MMGMGRQELVACCTAWEGCTLYLALHWPNARRGRGAAMQPHLHCNVKYLMGEMFNTASFSLIVCFTGYWSRLLILACIDEARQVDQTCFPCMEKEGGVYLAIAVRKKSKYDSFCSGLCIDSSENNLLSYAPRYRWGRNWLLLVAQDFSHTRKCDVKKLCGFKVFKEWNNLFFFLPLALKLLGGFLQLKLILASGTLFSETFQHIKCKCLCRLHCCAADMASAERTVHQVYIVYQ